MSYGSGGRDKARVMTEEQMRELSQMHGGNYFCIRAMFIILHGLPECKDLLTENKGLVKSIFKGAVLTE